MLKLRVDIFDILVDCWCIPRFVSNVFGSA